jgi:penicillin-binding protein 1C
MGRSSKVKRTRGKVAFTVLLLFSVFYYFCLPKPLFEKPFSTLILDKNGSVLSARIAEDDQWRFVPNDSIPNKFEQCILTFEDKYFYSHPGFNPVSLARALWKNLRAGKVVSGGSTLSMQVIRMSRNNPARTVWEKCKEITLATRLELAYSKREILSFYCGYAPFGGNTVGIEAASWRYFGRSPFDLSWAEAATLAVLPNAPGLIHPGKNRDQLKRKRNRLLQLLVKEGIMDRQQYELALLETLPDKPFPLPNASPHLAEWLIQKKGSNRYQTTLEDRLQEICIQSLERFKPTHEANEVYNGAVLLIDAETGEVKAYVGNHNNPKTPGFHNDMVQASRSSGSILKPFLYSSMLSNGSLWPKELLKDTPLILADFKPENFSHQYKGAVPADEALSQSLNIPFVLLLKEYGIQRFKEDLQAWGFSTINRSANNYGLSLILGGAEVNMWDLGNAYYRFAKKLKEYEVGELKEASSSIHVLTDQADRGKPIDINQGAIHHTIQAMTQLTRPHTELGWQFFDNQQIAWKTGTSFGHRDAWAVGMTSRYIAVVWIGNSSGEARFGWGKSCWPCVV